MSSLKDALQKAGFVATKKENERAKRPKKEVSQAQTHQEQRNFCDHCKNLYPDVEFYSHRNRSIEAQWLCLKCADYNQILDDFRTTAQSDYSIKNVFLRRYGHTRPSGEFRRTK